MPRVMVTLRLDPEQASLPEVRRLLGLAEDEVDPTFGVVNISPAEHRYTILVDEAAAERVAGAPASRACSATPGSSRTAPRRIRAAAEPGGHHPRRSAVGPLPGG
jgi:hypothetical protein